MSMVRLLNKDHFSPEMNGLVCPDCDVVIPVRDVDVSGPTYSYQHTCLEQRIQRDLSRIRGANLGSDGWWCRFCQQKFANELHLCSVSDEQPSGLIDRHPHPSLEHGTLHIVASSQDTSDIWRNTGAIAHETMLGKSSLFDMVERANVLRQYGQLGIFRLVYVGTPEECDEILRGEGK